MKVAFLTETNYTGKWPTDFPNSRTEIAWQITLDADHFNIHQYENVKYYDVVFIIFPKATVRLNRVGVEMTTSGTDKDITIYSKPIVETLKKHNGKVCNIQEGPSDFFNDYDLSTQFHFYNLLSECDVLFAHNEYDTHFYKGLFPQTKVRVIPSLMIPINIPSVKEEKAIIGGNFARWYGGFQSYIVATEFQVPIFVPTSHCKRRGEEQVPGLTQLPWVMWNDWMKQLSTFKYAVNLMPTIAAGTFSMNCLSGDTSIITLNGIKNIKEVLVGDYVISKNMINGKTEWKPVVKTIIAPPEKTYKIQGRSIDFITTGNHNLLIKKRDGKRKNNIGYKNEYAFERVIDLYSHAKQLKCRRKMPDFTEIERTPEIHKQIYPYHNTNGAALLGWFISEGNTRNWETYPSDNRIDIGQRKKVNFQNYNEIVNLLRKMKKSPNEYEDRISFTDKNLKKYLIENVGRLCHVKQIPKECFTWSLEMRKSLWNSMMKGDGDKKYTTYTTTSPQLQKDFALLSLTLGVGITLSKPIIRKSDKHHTLYQIYLRKVKGNLLYAKNISEDKYQETYCIEVKDNHNFVAGRNGKFQFIGNCAYFGIPCIGNENVDTQSYLFPELSIDVNDIHMARHLAIQLKSDQGFYEHVSSHAKHLLKESVYLDQQVWLNHVKGALQ